jgi:ribose transport system substrate-binding protein
MMLSFVNTGCAPAKPNTPPADTAASPSKETTTELTASTGGVKRLVFITNGDDPYWDALRSGLNDANEKLKLGDKGLKAVMDVNDGTPQGQINKLRQLQSQPDVAGVAISVINASNAVIAGEMAKLQAKGIPVIAVDSDIDRTKYRDSRSFYLGTDNIVGGRMLGQAAKIILEARGKTAGGYVQFAGFTDVDNASARMNGVREALGDGFTEKDRMSDEMDLSRARDNVRNAINNHRADLVALVGIWAYNAPAIAQIVDSSNLRKDITVVTFDAQAEAIADMAKGRIDAMVVQNPFMMGFETARLLTALLEKDEATIDSMFPNRKQPISENPTADIYTTGLRLVAPDSDTSLKKEQFDDKIVEFMTLSEFQAWLAKYNLKSS